MKLSVLQKVYFFGEVPGYTVMAVNDRYAICSRKFNSKYDAKFASASVESGAYCTFLEAIKELRKFPVYSILDLKEMVRGTDNYVFCPFDYSNKDDCDRALREVTSGEMEISRRGLADLVFDEERMKKSNEG